MSVRNGSDPNVLASVLDSNQADHGAALWFDFLTGGVVQGCTIVFNDGQAGDGGSLYFNALSDPVVTETIIAFGTGGGATGSAPGANPAYGCNDSFANVGGDSLRGGVDLGDNISADPLFCDASHRNYWLDPASPCLPAGNCGLRGAFGEGDCTAVTVSAGVEASTWSRIKARFRSLPRADRRR